MATTEGMVDNNDDDNDADYDNDNYLSGINDGDKNYNKDTEEGRSAV